MLSAFTNCFKIPELKKKILFTLGIIVVYRIGCYIPTPGVNGAVLAEFFERMNTTSGGSIFTIMNMFSGGSLEKLTIFSLGIMPYISSSIIMQLLTAVIPALEKLAKEGQAGYHKINQYTRYGTVVLSLVQSYFIALWLESPQAFEGLHLVNNPGFGFRVITTLTLTAGTIFLMWLGEQIQERGIGNGISLIITAGIISAAPAAINNVILLLSPETVGVRQLQPLTLLIMVFFLVAVVISITLITQGQRRIPVQYARRIVGRKVYGGQSTYIPLKVDTAGVIAIIFAQSIILFPATLASFIPHPWFQGVAGYIARGHFWYYFSYGLLIVFFCYFYTAIVFNPVDVAENMKKHGGFIPGVRPGTQTSDFLDFIMTRITLAGSLFVCVIAIMPDAIMASFKVPYLVASFFGGTGVLIIVGVMLDTMKQVESHLLMRNYDGFMRSGHLRGRRA
ncbi:MAG: preprotein translocase subunit SecY [Omnitrophica WOR_2 bacterium RIFCSPHIGHO2_01_FULL_48_9]|nr:MAG: preprotein translocase subunit SecY [Omnitrophica WOR_2 bacterium RIFCSPHIGHO2_02_FULL_48_11]OGX33327.1 MAG: preprotein translocase subunit SecY [Omnitrophica WOR_2 bacterium RIFCSPHIGHO2_01_FULL_48_9]